MKSTRCDEQILDILLENRGLQTDEEKQAFIDLAIEFHDPYLMKDMEKAVARIAKAIEADERVMIFGDYDVDGLTSAAILYHALKKLNAKHSVRLPNREKDGYGLSQKFMEEFVKIDVKLVITVDCGISSAKEIKYALENDIDTIITDHHQIPENFPEASHAIIHPKQEDCSYPFEDLTGAGVALKLAHALYLHFLGKEEAEEAINELLELAALGTIADLGPIRGENRTIVKQGLQNLTNTNWPGLKVLLDMVKGQNKEVNTTTVGFQIAPRLNAAGRIGDPYSALKLLIGEEGENLHQYGKELEEINQERQKMTIESYEEAQAFFKDLESKNQIPHILVAHSPNWHVGILGLSASRLADKYGRPAIVLQDLGDTLVASARSIDQFDIIEAIASQKDILTSFGGHKAAAGFNLKKEHLEAFKINIEKFAEEKLKDKDLRPVLKIECEVKEDNLGEPLVEDIWKLKPFGIRNPRPVFKLKNVTPLFPKAVGRNEDHIKFEAKIGDKNINAIGFRLGKHLQDIREAKSMDVVCYLEINEWNDHKNLQLEIVDFEIN